MIKLIPYLFLSLSAYASCAQSFEYYDTSLAKSRLLKEFQRGDFWLMLTDSTETCYFKNKKDARKNSEVIPIAVYSVTDSKDYKADYSIFVGRVNRGKEFLSFIKVWLNRNTKTWEIVILDKVPNSGELVFIKDIDEIFAIDKVPISLSDTLELVSHNRIEIPNVKSNAMESKWTEYYDITKEKVDDGFAITFKSSKTLIKIGTIKKKGNSEFKTVDIVYNSKIYKLEFDGFRNLYSGEGKFIATYDHDSGIVGIDSVEEEFNIDFNKKKQVASITLKSNGDQLITSSIEGKILRIESFSDSELLNLVAILLQWEGLLLWYK
ncbi:MAG: hypothetical protein BroJett042_25380 [Bacteroidota bacterium]|nr:MAG: hypothetical protein BroJett042_25380 [Bacteroidota bacterium]